MSRKARGVREALRMAVGRGVQGLILNPRRNMDYIDSCSRLLYQNNSMAIAQNDWIFKTGPTNTNTMVNFAVRLVPNLSQSHMAGMAR